MLYRALTIKTGRRRKRREVGFFESRIFLPDLLWSGATFQAYNSMYTRIIIASISLFLSMSKLLYLWRMKILWGQFPSSGICSVHKGGRKVCISFEDWETPYELFLLPPLCLLLIHPTLSNNQHTPELFWNKESKGQKNFFEETKFEYITPLPASYKHCCCACFFLHLDFTSNCWFHSRWFICLWVTWADYCGWVFVIS